MASGSSPSGGETSPSSPNLPVVMLSVPARDADRPATSSSPVQSAALLSAATAGSVSPSAAVLGRAGSCASTSFTAPPLCLKDPTDGMTLADVNPEILDLDEKSPRSNVDAKAPGRTSRRSSSATLTRLTQFRGEWDSFRGTFKRAVESSLKRQDDLLDALIMDLVRADQAGASGPGVPDLPHSSASAPVIGKKDSIDLFSSPRSQRSRRSRNSSPLMAQPLRLHSQQVEGGISSAGVAAWANLARDAAGKDAGKRAVDSKWWSTSSPNPSNASGEHKDIQLAPEIRWKRSSVSLEHSGLEVFLSRNPTLSKALPIIWWLQSYYQWAMSIEEPIRHGPLVELLDSIWFVAFISFTIFANAVYTVYMADYGIRNLDSSGNVTSRVVEIFFSIIFVFELLLKLIVHRKYFFWNRDTRWNLLDLVLVTSSIADQAMLLALADASAPNTNMSFLRSLRILRLTRIFRVLRVIRVVRELRNILVSLVGSFISLFWCLLMLGLIIVCFSLVFVMVITEYLINYADDIDPAVQDGLLLYFGGVVKAMRTLYMATTGGDDWSTYYDFLAATGSATELLFIFFISFFNFAVFNVLTGIFVDNAMKVSRADRDIMVMEQRQKEFRDAQVLKAVCEEMDEDKSGGISWQEFKAHLQDPKAAAHLAAIGLDVHDARVFFEILELVAGKPEVDIDIFVRGCMRMKGSATSIDMQTLAYEVRQIRKEQEKFGELVLCLQAETHGTAEALHRSLDGVCSCVENLQQLDNTPRSGCYSSANCWDSSVPDFMNGAAVLQKATTLPDEDSQKLLSDTEEDVAHLRRVEGLKPPHQAPPGTIKVAPAVTPTTATATTAAPPCIVLPASAPVGEVRQAPTKCPVQLPIRSAKASAEQPWQSSHSSSSPSSPSRTRPAAFPAPAAGPAPASASASASGSATCSSPSPRRHQAVPAKQRPDEAVIDAEEVELTLKFELEELGGR